MPSPPKPTNPHHGTMPPPPTTPTTDHQQPPPSATITTTTIPHQQPPTTAIATAPAIAQPRTPAPTPPPATATNTQPIPPLRAFLMPQLIMGAILVAGMLFPLTETTKNTILDDLCSFTFYAALVTIGLLVSVWVPERPLPARDWLLTFMKMLGLGVVCLFGAVYGMKIGDVRRSSTAGMLSMMVSALIMLFCAGSVIFGPEEHVPKKESDGVGISKVQA